MSAIGSAPRPTAARSRRTLLSGGAMAAALAVTGQPAPVRAADGYNATISLPDSVNYSGATNANQARVQLTSPNSVITWVPTQVGGTTVNFQDAGGVTTFAGPSGADNFIVLNRLPATETRGITFNGTTNGVLFGGTTPAGTIWFDSPGGIFVSGTATFNVGSLLLSTNAIGYSNASGYGAVNPNSILFNGPAGSQSAINIASGAQLLASGAGSFGSNYVALVAPRINQAGLVSAAQAAYVAAEAGDMTINSGLFSIAITTGTTATISESAGPDGIVGTADDLTGTGDDVIGNVALRHSGTTRLNAAEGQANRAFMVAVPKNSAITMLVGGTVSYASAAAVEDGAVVLSTGNISDGRTPQTVNANPGETVGGSADIVFGDGGTFNSVFAASRNNVRTRGGLTVNGDVELFGSTSVAFGGDAGTVSVNRNGAVGGNLTLTSYRDEADGSRTGGIASLYARNDAVVSIAGSALADSSGAAQSILVPSLAAPAVAAAAPTGQGGTTSVTVAGARMTIADRLVVRADGSGIDGGLGKGGVASVVTTNGGLTVGFGPDNEGSAGLLVSADGSGGFSGGAGQGGTARIVANGTYAGGDTTSIGVAGLSTVSASGFGGDAASGETGGTGTGGIAQIEINGTTVDGVLRRGFLSSGTRASGYGAIAVTASGVGGGYGEEGYGSANGGAGIGGTATMNVVQSGFEASRIVIGADGTGRDAPDVSGFFDDDVPGNGGAGQGGIASLTVSDTRNTKPAIDTLTGDLTLSAKGIGGRGGGSLDSESGYGSNGGTGGSGTGGRAAVAATTDGHLYVGGLLTIDSSGAGGAGGASATLLGGAGGVGAAGVESTVVGGVDPLARGGSYMTMADGASIELRSTIPQTVTVQATGTGGAGGTGPTGYGAGGDGFGGSARVAANAAFFLGRGFGENTTNALNVIATGLGGDSGVGGRSGDAFGTGGNGFGGGYGATAGGASIGVTGTNSFASAPTMLVDAGATGGRGNVRGGDATGGAASATFDRGTIDLGGSTTPYVTTLSILADATGGGRTNDFAATDAGVTGGGNATGGRASLTASNGGGRIDNADLTLVLSADGRGGGTSAGPFSGARYAGGSGSGGSATIASLEGGTLTPTRAITLRARGFGGRGLFAGGGTATGGTASVLARGGTVATGGLTLDASALGGGSDGDGTDAHDGGAATGGLASLTIARSTATGGAITVTGATRLDAGATGGRASESGYGSAPITPASGGAATGGGFGTLPGGATVDIQTGVASLGALTLNAAGTGGDTAAGGATGSGRGGLAGITLGTAGQTGGVLEAAGITLDAFGEAGEHASAYGNGGAGALGTGGRALLGLVGGTLTNTGSLVLDATGRGGDGDDYQLSSGIGRGGDGGAGTGGSATVDVTDAVLTTGAITARADGTGGRGGAGQSGGGGIGALGMAGGAETASGAPLTAGVGARVAVAGTTGRIVLRGNLAVSASGVGGNGGTDAADSRSGAAGGLGQGGRAVVSASGGGIGPDTAVSSSLSLVARGEGGDGGGTRGADGDSLTPRGGAGGAAVGGNTALSATTGGAIAAFNLTLDGVAIGGDGAPDVRGGDAVAGRADITAASGTIALAAVGGVQPLATLDLRATGGRGGGSATGGAARVIASGTGRYVDAMSVDVSATGAAGADGRFGASGVDGGDATAGSFTLDLASGSVDGLALTALALAGRGGNAIEEGYGTTGGPGAAGGSGGAGGDAGGGAIAITVGDGATLNLVGITATRTAGAGGNGSRGATGATGTRGADGTPTSLDGGAGGTGGSGQAGGAGGRGGDATGVALTLTAGQGAISFPNGGTAAIDLTARAGAGGTGGLGGTGGAGGPGGTAGTGGTPPVTGTPGATGAQGIAGAGGAGGAGGNAGGGSVVLAAIGGTLGFDGLRIGTDATGGNGGAGGEAGPGRTPVAGLAGAGGNGIAGNVSLATSDVVTGGVTRFGRITGGALTISATGEFGVAGDFNSLGTNGSGRVALSGEGRFLSTGTAPVGSIALASLDISAFGDAPAGVSPTRDPLLASVDLLARGGRISIAGPATIATGYHASLRVEDGGRIDVGATLDVSGGTYVTASQANATGTPANLIAANMVRFTSSGQIVSAAPIVATAGESPGTIAMTGDSVDADGLTATDSITLRGGSFVRAGNLATTAPVDPAATSLDGAGGGTITLIAGENFVTDLLPTIELRDADIEITGTVSASNAVRATAGGDIRVLDDARILSGNFLGLDAGDDVTIASGTVVRAALTPLADPAAGTGPLDLDTPAGLVITAGRQPTSRAVDGDFATVTIAGTVSSGVVTNDAIAAAPGDRRGILLAGQAVQTEGGTIAGRSLTVQVDDAPLPAADRTGGVENLSAGCLRGDACLGTVDLTDLLTVGPLTGTVGLPSSARLAGGSQTRRTSIRTQGDIALGDGAGTTFTASELLRVQSTLGAVRLADGTVLRGTTAAGVVQVLGAAGIDGPGGTIDGAGTVGLSTGTGGLSLASLIAGDHVETLNPDLTVGRADGLTVAGPVTIADLFSVANGAAAIDATGDISIDRITVGDGFAIAIASSGGDASVRDADASELGTAGSIGVTSASGTASLQTGTAQGNVFVSGGQGATGGVLNGGDVTVISSAGDASIDVATARRDITLAAAGLASANTLRAGDDIDMSGATLVLGRATTDGSFVETGYGADGSNIRLAATGALRVTTEADAFDTVRATTARGTVTAASLTAGDDVIVSGNGIVLTSARARGTGLETGYGVTPDGSNIRLAVAGGTGLPVPSITVTLADAATDVVLTASDAGVIGATSLIAGRDITATAEGAAGIVSARAGRDVRLTSTAATARGDDLVAGRDIAIAALGDVTIGNARANGPAVFATGTTGTTPTGGLVSITAGRVGTTGGYAAADITINGTVGAEGAVLATAGRDILVAGTGRVQSSNRITLNAGDDVRIATGAAVRAALNPLPTSVSPSGVVTSPAGLSLLAGNLALGYTPPAGNVAALVIDGTISSPDRPILLSGGAIQAPGSAIVAGALSINVPGAPAAGAAQSNDNGGLTTCLQGDVCLGAITLTGVPLGSGGTIPGQLLIGRGTSPSPTNVRITGPVSAGSVQITALDTISLGSATPQTVTATGPVDLVAQAGAVNLLGRLTLAGGGTAGGTVAGRTVGITAGTNVNGTTASVASTGPLTIRAAGSVDLAATGSAEATRITATNGAIRLGAATTGAIDTTSGGPGSGLFLNAGGNVTAGNVDATGDLFVRAGNVAIDTAQTRNGGSAADAGGSDIDIVATGAVLLGTATASDDARITAGTTLTLASLTANGETANDGADLGGNIVLGGTTVNAGSLLATTNVTATASDLLRVDRAEAGGAVNLSASGLDRAATTDAPDGTLAVTLGTIDAGTGLRIGAPNGGVRFDSLAAPTIALTAATRIAGGDLTARGGGITVRAPGDVRLGDALAADDIFVTAGGSVTADSLTSGSASSDARYRAIEIVAGGTIGVTGASTAFRGDVDFTAAGAITIGAASAGDSVLLLSNDGAITTAALTAGTFPEGAATDDEYRGAIGVSAALDATIGAASAPGDVGILSRGGGIVVGDVTSGANAVLLAANAVTTGAVRATNRFYVANASMASLLGEAGDASRLDGATPVATGGAVTLRGAVSAGPVTIAAGDALGFTSITSTDAVRLSSARGAIAGGIVRAAGDITLAAAGTVRVTTDIATPGTISATGTGIALNALGALRIGTVEATAGDVSLTSGGGAVSVDRATATGNVLLASGSGVNGTPDDARTVTALDVRAGNDVTATAFGRVDVRSATAGRTIMLSSAGDVRLGTATAGLDVLAYGRASVDGGTIVAGRDLELVTRYVIGDTRVLTRDVTLGSGRAGDDLVLAAFGQVRADGLVTTGAGADAGDGQYGNRAGSGIYVVAERGIRIGTATSAGAIDYVNAAQTINGVPIGDGSGDIRVGTQSAAGDLTAFNTDSAIVFTSATAGGAIDLSATGGAGAITADALRAGTTLDASASGDVALGVGRAATTIALESTRGRLTAGDLLAADSIAARAAGALAVRDAIATADGGSVTLAGGFPFAGGSGVTVPYLLAGDTGVTGTVSAGRSVRIEAGGDLSLGSAARVRSNGTIVLASGDDIVVDAGGLIGLGHVTVATPGTATGARVGGPADSVTLNAGLLRAGTANAAGNGASGIVVNGTVDGLRIALVSETIAVGTGGRVGSAATELADYANGGTGLTTVGGTGDVAGYAVSQQVLGRTRAQAIRVSGAGDVAVQTLALTGSAATDGNLIGNAASFEIRTPGSVRVEGAATIASAAQTDLFAITAGDRITVVTPGGSIALRDAGGTLAGRLRLAARRITVATPAAISAIEGLSGVDAKDERLGANDGTVSEAGFLQADAIEFRVGNGLYIQNSGTGTLSTARRGITAGSGGIAIATTGTAPAEIVLNGRQPGAGGVLVSGAALIPLLRLSGTAQGSMASLDPRSTANGCLISGLSCRFDPVVVVPDPMPDPGPQPEPQPEPPVLTPPSQPVQDVINAIIDGQDSLTGAISSVVQQLNSPLIELIDFTPFRLSGIIDEPVTGAGNDDFYTTFDGADTLGAGLLLNEQVTGSGNDDLTAKAEKDGRCDRGQSATDPDCN